MADHEDYLPGETPSPHKTTHQNGGADEISVAGLSGETEGLAAHKLLPTVHQDAPALIETHRLVADAHHAKYTDAEARASINNVFGSDGKADVNIDLDTHKLINVVDPINNQDADTKKGRDDAIAGLGGVVAADADLTDHALVRGDGGGKKVQTSAPFVTDDGEMSNPSQPCFLAMLTSAQADVTGDGTNFACTGAFWTEIFDQSNDFLNGVFTAPVSGRYQFSFSIELTGLTSSHTSQIIVLRTSNRDYWMSNANPWAMTGLSLVMNFSCLVDMDASKTAYILVIVSNGGKVVEVAHDSTVMYFSGCLIC